VLKACFLHGGNVVRPGNVKIRMDQSIGSCMFTCIRISSKGLYTVVACPNPRVAGSVDSG
jgi:hypothetical protein